MVFVAVAMLVASLFGVRPAEAQQRLVVRVVTAPEGAPLGYAVVSAPSLALERFGGPNGLVALDVPQPGPLLIRVKRLGFTPRDTLVTVTAAVAQEIVVALERFTYRLPAVRVVELPPCRRPGLRNDTPREVRGVVDQLRQNAERYRLLASAHPFAYRAERVFRRKIANGDPRLERSDTVIVSGTPEWRYRPGEVVARDLSSDSYRGWVMHIPLLNDIAEDGFIDAHCFHVMGIEQKEGASLLRLEAVASERLRGSDVDLTVWLDPTDFRLRFASFRLTNFRSRFPTLDAVESEVAYVEVAPFIPVMHELRARNVDGRGRPPARQTIFFEDQRILELSFVGEPPPGFRTP
jgi:hypothetical protein